MKLAKEAQKYPTQSNRAKCTDENNATRSNEKRNRSMLGQPPPRASHGGCHGDRG